MRVRILVTGLAAVALAPPMAAQEEADSTVETVVYRGEFRGVAGHQAGGEYQVLERDGRWVIRMTESFTSEKVPDGHVYLSNHAESLGRDAYHVNRLIRRQGEQEYPLPEDVDPAAFKFLLVWCVRFDVGVAAGPLET